MSPSSLVPHKVVVCRNSRKGGRLRPAAREPAGHACAPHHQVISEASAVSSLYPAQVVTTRLRIIYELWVSLLSTRLGFLAHGHAVISSQAWEHKIDVAVCFSVHFGHPRLLSPTFPPAEVVCAVCQRWPNIFARHRRDPRINASALS